MDSLDDAPSYDLLLATKLSIPQTRPNLVARPRLIDELNRGMARRVVLLSAQAGSGKTTLLGDWVTRTHHSVAWFSLDGNDNDLTRFFSYVISALQTIQPRLGQAALDMVRSPELVPIESILAALLNEISSSPRGFSLVLDDYHVITDPAIHRALAFLIDRLPTQMHLIISSRADPPLPLARLRAYGQLVELRADDLRFTLEEAAAFFGHIMDLKLTPEDVAALEQYAEGWIAGLQLAALSMQGCEDIPAFIEQFTGNHRYLVDYLAEEVLQRQPEDIQRFMMHTSILERLSDPLCQAVTGRADSQVVLEALDQANLFVVPLDDRRRWYRYHHLFADFLRDRMQKIEPDQPPLLHRRAAQWYENNGLTDEAVTHLLMAADSLEAVRLIERSVPSLMDQRRASRLSSWLDELPDALVRSRPTLCLLHGWALVYSRQLDRFDLVAERLREAENVLEMASAFDRKAASARLPDPEQINILATLRATAARIQGDVSHTLELSRNALERALPADPTLRGALALHLGEAHRLTGDLTTAARVFSEASALNRLAGNLPAALIAACQLGQVQMTQGHLNQALRTFRQALRLALEETNPAQLALPVVGLIHAGISAILREWNDLEAAAFHATESIRLVESGEDVPLMMISYLAWAQVQLARHDLDGAAASYERAEWLAQTGQVPQRLVAQLGAHRARLWIASGDLAAADRWAQNYRLSAEKAPDHGGAFGPLTLARLLIARQELTEAGQILEQVGRAAQADSRLGDLIESLVLRVVRFHAQRDFAHALRALEQALELAEPEGFTRVFVDGGSPIASLLRTVAQRGAAPSYVRKLLSVLAGAGGAPFGSVTQTATSQNLLLPVPLSERELEILRLIAAGLSNQEIAEKLVVTLETIKWHVKNVYRKLDVGSRTQALARSKELQLL